MAIIENLKAAFSQTNLRRAEGWADLDPLLEANRLAVTSILRVESVVGMPTYRLISISIDGEPTAQALMDETGWLPSVRRSPFGERLENARSDEWIASIAASVGYGAARIRRVHLPNNVTAMSGSADYDPFFELSMPGRPTLFVASDAAIYSVDPRGEGRAFWSDGERRLSRVR